MKEISTNDTIGIREFMEEYLKVKYTDSGHLTHKKMHTFLIDHAYSLPTRVSFDSITKEDITSGKVLLVRAEGKVLGNHHSKSKDRKVIAYQNPLRKSKMFMEINRDKEALKIIREKIISGNIISEEQRQKIAEMHKAKYIQKKAKKEALKLAREAETLNYRNEKQKVMKLR